MENATPGKEPKKPIGGSPSDHLANERTYLAWVRTSIGIMAFGFVVVKFNLFIKQIAIVLRNKLPSAAMVILSCWGSSLSGLAH